MNDNYNHFERRFLDFLQENHFVPQGSNVALAVSGGVDSMVMMHLFHALAPRTTDLSVIHVNHHLRGEESDGDESFVRKAAASMSLQFHSIHVDVPAYQAAHKVSKQEAARELRYRAFETARRNAGADSVATAHHADDNAETVLMNALRGAGIRGLSGIPLRREHGSVIRPLLWATRQEINEYAALRGIEYREDSSNLSMEYTRNALRKVILPGLEALSHSNVVDSLNRVSAVMRSLQERLASEMRDRMPSIVSQKGNRVTVALGAFLSEPFYLQEEIILEILRRLEIEVSARKVRSCLDLCARPSGRHLRLSSRWCLYRDRDALIFGEPLDNTSFETPVEVGKEYFFPGFRFGSKELGTIPHPSSRSGSVEYVDGERLGSNLVLRTWHRGDWFQPLGMDQKKKLSDFFTNEKVSLLEKQSVPILESDGSIVWVCGLRLDQRFRITQGTKHAVKLEYSHHSTQ